MCKKKNHKKRFWYICKSVDKQKFADMYDQHIKMQKKDISKKEFAEKYEKIYSGIELKA